MLCVCVLCVCVCCVCVYAVCESHLSHVVGNVKVHIHAHYELDQVLGEADILMDDSKVKRPKEIKQMISDLSTQI